MQFCTVLNAVKRNLHFTSSTTRLYTKDRLVETKVHWYSGLNSAIGHSACWADGSRRPGFKFRSGRVF